MNNENKNTEEQPEEEGEKNFKLLYIAIGCFAAACILFVLAIIFPFVHVTGASVYLIIASMTCSLASMSFINGQKRKANHRLCKIFQVLSYVIIFADAIFFVIGASLSGSQNA